MARTTKKKAVKQLAQTAASVTVKGNDAPKPPAVAGSAKPPSTPAAVPLQTLTPVRGSRPIQSPAQQTQDAPAKALAAPGSLTTAAQSPKPAAQPEPIKLPEQAAVVAEAPMLSVVQKVKVTFLFPTCPCSPKRVSLSGDFNGWSPEATPMKQYDDGRWETTVELAPGRYEYKFVRDGEWMPDLLARDNVLNRHGTLNSVIEVRA